MGFETWLRWIEGGLSLVGLAAISTWLYRWVSKFSQKQRELSQIDKEIRTALREAFEDQKVLRESEREVYSQRLEKLREEIETLDQYLKSKDTMLVKHQKRDAIARLAAAQAVLVNQLELFN